MAVLALSGAPASATTSGATPGGAPAPARLVTITVPAPTGAIDSKWLSYPGPPRANVLLPAGYDPNRRYPLVVFLNGLSFNYDSYVQYGLSEPFERWGAIVVMPEGGNGWYADWWNDGERGSSLVGELRPRYGHPHDPAPLPDPYRAALPRAHRHLDGWARRHLPRRPPARLLRVRRGALRIRRPAVERRDHPGCDGGLLERRRRTATPIRIPSTDRRTASTPTGTTRPCSRKPRETRVFVSTGTGVPSASDPNPGSFAIAEEKIIYPMSENYHAALVAAGVRRRVSGPSRSPRHPRLPGRDRRDAPLGPLRAGAARNLARGRTAPSPPRDASGTSTTDSHARRPRSCDSQRSGDRLSISAAGSDVTITTETGCTIHTATPAWLRIRGGHGQGDRGIGVARSPGACGRYRRP